MGNISTIRILAPSYQVAAMKMPIGLYEHKKYNTLIGIVICELLYSLVHHQPIHETSERSKEDNRSNTGQLNHFPFSVYRIVNNATNFSFFFPSIKLK